MPSYFTSATNNATNVAASFQVTGTSITGSANMQGVCGIGGGFGEGFVNAITGTVTPDGTFTAGFSAAGTNAQTLTIQGTVPAEAGGGWEGTFTFTSPGSVDICATSYAADFTAVSFPIVLGAFSGSGALTSGVLSSGSAISGGTVYSVDVNLTQEGIGADQAVTGSIKTTGFPCFTSGTSETYLNDITSNVLNLSYVMDDGATVQLAGSVNNITSSQIAVPAIYVRGDACAGNYYFDEEAAQSTSSLLLNK